MENKNNNPVGENAYQSWPLDALIDHIEEKHHQFIKQSIPLLQEYLDKICRVHGHIHGELFKIRDEFNASAIDLIAHIKKEEGKLFPYIREMVIAKNNHQNIESPSFGAVKNPITIMLREHDTEDIRFKRIAKLCNNYNPPEDACASYKKTFVLLQEFDLDLHVHIALENTIVFPRAIELDTELIQS